MFKDLPQGETQYEDEQESILALAGDPVAYMNLYGGVLTALTTGLEKATFNVRLYNAEQVLAARKPLEDEIERLRSVVFAAETLDKAELGQQLVEKGAEIENVRRANLDCVDHFNAVIEDLATAQAQIVGYRAVIERGYNSLASAAMAQTRDGEAAWEAMGKSLDQPSDTSALEAMIAKAGEVMRDRAAMRMEDETAYCSAHEIRALPGVKLEDLQG